MTTEWKWRVYLFVRAVDNTAENRTAFAGAFANNSSGESEANEAKLFNNAVKLSTSGELPAQAFGVNTAAKTAMRTPLKDLLDNLTNARYVVVANTDLPGHPYLDFILTNFPVTPSGVVTWQMTLGYLEDEFGLIVIPDGNGV